MRGIYFIYNKASNKTYIGQSTDIGKRFKEHKQKLRLNKHHNRHLQLAWNKYGEDFFEFSLFLEVATDESLPQLEKKLIALFNTNDDEYGYNLTLGGDGVIGYTHTKETIERMKANHHNLKGESHPFFNKTHSEEYKKKLSESKKGKGNHMYGRKHTDEARKKISEKMKIENARRKAERELQRNKSEVS